MQLRYNSHYLIQNTFLPEVQPHVHVVGVDNDWQVGQRGSSIDWVTLRQWQGS